MKKFWIKERHNPQFPNGIYYVACSQLTKREAMRKEKTLYGFNVMLPFDTKEQYESKCKELGISA